MSASDEIQPNLNYFLPDIKVGLEYEIEKYTMNQKAMQKEAVHLLFSHDDSLKDQGQEIIFNTPKEGEDIELAIQELKFFIKNTTIPVNPSHRCSIHVHVDHSKLKKVEKLYAVALSILCDPCLWKCTTEERKANTFCIPIYDTTLSKTQVISSVNGPHTKNTKYLSIGLFRLHDLGTIEYRHLQTILDFNFIRQWIKTLQEIKNYFSPTKIKDFFNNPTSNPFLLYEEIWKNNPYMLEIIHQVDSDEVERAFLLARSIVK